MWKGQVRIYTRPKVCQLYSNWIVVESSPAQSSRISFFMMNFSSSYSYERNLPQWDRLWFMDICLNVKNTTQMRDRKQFQTKNSTFSRFIFISQYDSAPIMPELNASNHSYLKLKMCLLLLNLRK